MQRDKAQINRLIKDLVDKGLVVKELSKQDKRASELSLSNEGGLIYTQFQEIERRANQVMLKGFSQSEKMLFKELLVRINRNLEAGD